MYTTVVSTLISSLSLDHLLYADDTQLFFSFHLLNFDSCISHLQNALEQVSSRMTANLLSSANIQIRHRKSARSELTGTLVNQCWQIAGIGFLKK